MIIDLLGSPNEKIWPGFSELPAAKNFTFKYQPYNNIKQRLPFLASSGVSLINKLFMFDPEKRISAEECLDCSYFREHPLPTDREMMPTFPEHRNFSRTPKDGAGEGTSKKRKTTQVTDKLVEHLKSKKKKKWSYSEYFFTVKLETTFANILLCKRHLNVFLYFSKNNLCLPRIILRGSK